MRPLILTGGPAVGKSTCGRMLATGRSRAAFIDADDVRQLIVAGDATLWSGSEGEAQLLLAARNTTLLASNLIGAEFDVTIADFVTPRSLALYREALPDCLVVQLQISLDHARTRAATRPKYLTDAEFELLHQMVAEPLDADAVIDVSGLSVTEQVAALRAMWLDADRPRMAPHA